MVHYKRTHNLLNVNDISLKYPEPVRLTVTCIVVLVDVVVMLLLLSWLMLLYLKLQFLNNVIY